MTTFHIIRKDEARHKNNSFEVSVLLFDDRQERKNENVGGAILLIGISVF